MLDLKEGEKEKKKKKEEKSYSVILGKHSAADHKSSWESFMIQPNFIVFEKRTQQYKKQLQKQHYCVTQETS